MQRAKRGGDSPEARQTSKRGRTEKNEAEAKGEARSSDGERGSSSGDESSAVPEEEKPKVRTPAARVVCLSPNSFASLHRYPCLTVLSLCGTPSLSPLCALTARFPAVRRTRPSCVARRF